MKIKKNYNKFFTNLMIYYLNSMFKFVLKDLGLNYIIN